MFGAQQEDGMTLASSGLSRPGRVFPVVKAALAVGAVLAAIAIAVGLHVSARQNAEREARRLAVVLAEQTARTLQAIDLVLADVIQDADAPATEDAAHFRAALATPAIQRALRARVAGLPQAEAILAFAADGTALVSSREWPVPAINVADRAYFQAAREGTWRTPFLGEPHAARENGRRVFNVVHPVTSRSGAFLGVLVGSVDLDSIAGFHAAIGLPPGMGVALVRQDGVVLTRFPADLARQAGPAIAGLRGDEAGLVYGQQLANFPAAIEVSVRRAAIYADWRRQVAGLAAGTACGLLCLGLLLHALVRQFRRLEAAQAAAQEKSLLFETTLANMHEGLMMVTADNKVAVCNDRAIELLDLPPGLMRGRPDLDELLDWQWRTGEFGDSDAAMKAMRRNGGILERPHSYERQRPNGIWLEVRSAPLAGGGVVRTFTDVTRRHLADEQLSYAAHHDTLTGLSNRARFARQLDDAVHAAAADGSGPAVLYLDLDRFKLVNDTLGHRAGDELLQLVATRMRNVVRETDTLARTGGDEFGLLIPVALGIEAPLAVAQRLLHAVRQPYHLTEGPARIGVSIGIARFGVHGSSADELLRNADLALYRAKATGRDTACVFDPLLDARTQGEMVLVGALQFALQERQFTLAYQPILDLRTDCVVGAEALLRWQHPTRGTIPPGHFIPLAERTGLIVPLGRWAMQAACEEALTWASPVTVSVNVAPAQLSRREMLDEVREVLAATGLPPDRLKLEITESQLLEESDEVNGLLAGLRDLGVRLALDDFGTGHSSLSTLRAFPFSDLKIDRCFIQGMMQDPRSRGLLEAILQVCRVMELDCVAEGVETEEQLAAVRSLGCTHAQGYLIGRPEPAASIRRTLWRTASNSRPPATGDAEVAPARAVTAR
jgi:diguanylate cyclase (GGDEF)-like protein